MKLEDMKYLSKINKNVMQYIEENLQVGKSIAEICTKSNQFILNQFAFDNNTTMGISFPVSISPNNIVSNFSPKINDPNDYKIKEGDVLKVEYGLHTNGHPIISCQTFLINTENKIINDLRADVIMASLTGVQCLMRKIKINTKFKAFQDLIDDVANEFDCSVLNTVVKSLGHNELDESSYSRSSSIDSDNDDDNSMNETIQKNKLYSFDIALGTNKYEGNCDVEDSKHSYQIYELSPFAKSLKRKGDKKNGLKTDAGKKLFHSITQLSQQTCFPFSLSQLDSKQSRENLENFKLYTSKQIFGLKECDKRDLLNHYKVWKIQNTGCVARIRFTILISDRNENKEDELLLQELKYFTDLNNINGISDLIETNRTITNSKLINLLKLPTIPFSILY